MKRLIVDTSNILFRVAAAHGKYHAVGTPEDQAGLAMHMALNTLKSFYKKIQPDQVALAFEGTNNWRKEYTKSERCVSKQIYKANRVRDDSMVPFFELIRSFEQLAREHTSLVCISHPRLEGDDVIAGYAQRFSEAGDEVVILSGDKDFIQLLRLPGVSIVNPDDGKPRGLDKNGKKIDPNYFIFEKCFRGDPGDNVFSAYPRLRETKIRKAWEDEFERTNLMNHTWEFSDPQTGVIRTMKVADLFEENRLLMDLFAQPPEIREIIKQAIDEALISHGKFSLFHFQKFCGKYGLKRISEDAMSFIDLFASTGIKSPLKAEAKALREEKKKNGTLLF